MSDPFSTSALDATSVGRILIVDDDPGIQRFVLHALSKCGYIINAVATAEDALPLLHRGLYDVALVDLDLPGRSGLDLLAAIPPGGDVVPILLTGTQDVKAAVTAMKRGAFDYISKPTDADEIQWAVARAFGAAQARRRERTLERVVAEWEATFDACPDPLLVLGVDGQILRANRATGELAGSSQIDLRGRRVRNAFPGDLGATAARYLDTTLAPPQQATRVSDPATKRQFLVSGHRLPSTSDTAPVVVVARDVTTITEAERAKTKLAHQLLTAQEDERGRIAKELHDGLGQSLASVVMGLSTLVESPPASGLQERLEVLWRVASEAFTEVRRLAHQLRPPVLDHHGLLAALERLTDDFTRLHEVRAELIVSTPSPRRPPLPVELAVYRIVQEALANVAKHARARTADVLFEFVEDRIHVSITDDGAGFGPTDDSRHGIGLSDMRERTDMLGGTFRVKSVPGRGTTIDVYIPVLEDRP